LIETEPFSENLIDAVSGIKDTCSSLFDEDNIENVYRDLNSFEENSHMISHLLPISVIASNESSTVEEVATPVVISREGKRK